MNQIAECKLRAIAEMLRPDFRYELRTEDIRKALETLRKCETVTIREAAELAGITPRGLLLRVQKSGLVPAVSGDGTKRSPNRYRRSDIMPLL